ncbi:MAG: hypothetical protein Q8P51_19870 [Ignavibacteria bacterium]|nr:hypothetical protein [Ignavibacteria bacterium]
MAIPKDTKFEGDRIMKSKKRLMMFAFLFPLMLVFGILINLVYSVNYDEFPGIDWPVAILLAVFLDLFFTWRYRRDLKDDQKTT